ncbi:LysR family transcriptional regulator [Caulobacter sp. UNC358MFTsu5.1]|uniref:LysR family transcriptional regulator n=1 Tax=Caulobacter sp. UNC358MFTsu5.1 TaxID=1449049 RepID=UPI0004A6BB6B|nr:LysR family transcriptional regulator [Caulobacter sp. UNC358MFTsu5.1]
MNDAHFRTLDLNLLRVFDALLEEESATRAGSKLGLTQSAISHALGRLRLSLGDELFVRGPSGLQATPRAVEMGGPVRAALKMLEAAVTASRFDPTVDQRTFHISASAYLCSVLMPGVVRRVQVQAPGVKLRIRGIEGPLAEDLDHGRLDMVIGGFEHVAPRFLHKPLFTETGVWVIRVDHPVALAAGPDGITPQALAGVPYLVVSGGQENEEMRRGSRRELGLRRITSWSDDYALPSTRGLKGPVTVPDASSALVMVSQTDMAALLPRRLATLAADRGAVVLVEPSRHPEPAQFGAVIRGGESETGPVAWLMRLVAESAAEL